MISIKILVKIIVSSVEEPHHFDTASDPALAHGKQNDTATAWAPTTFLWPIVQNQKFFIHFDAVQAPAFTPT
jgi:hypothetical protein